MNILYFQINIQGKNAACAQIYKELNKMDV